MSSPDDLSSLLRQSQPQEIISFLRTAGEVGKEMGYSLYLVGGDVRDLLLKRPNQDVDLVVEGDALLLARHLAEKMGGEVISHPRFGTATFHRQGLRVDLATARTETYAKPGALPLVRPGSIQEDLYRRDFTINAMAIYLTPPRFGELLDPFKGRDDLRLGLIRVLHEGSFIDDATRILRAIRYEQRLGFKLEDKTEELMSRDLSMLKTISGDRLRHELEIVLYEERPELALSRAEGRGILNAIHPTLRGDEWIAKKFQEARKAAGSPAPELYLCLLSYRLSSQEAEDLVRHFRFPGNLAKAIRDTVKLKGEGDKLSQPDSHPSQIYHTLRGYSEVSIRACISASTSSIAAKNMEQYLERWQSLKPHLDGTALKAMGISQGPLLGKMLKALLEARLDGEVSTVEEERSFVERKLSQGDLAEFKES